MQHTCVKLLSKGSSSWSPNNLGDQSSSQVRAKYFLVSTTTKLNRTLKTQSVHHWKSNRKVLLFFLKSFYPLYLRVKSVFFLVIFDSFLVMLSQYFSVYFLKMCIRSVRKNLLVQISGKAAITVTYKNQ